MEAEEEIRLEKRFAKALSVLQSLDPDLGMNPTQSEKLRFYALYKQSTVGTCSIPRPSLWDAVGRAKWDAWQAVKLVNQAEAKEEYVNAAAKFLSRFPDRPMAQDVIQYFENSRAGLTGVDSDSDDDEMFSDRDMEDGDAPDADLGEMEDDDEQDDTIESDGHHRFNEPIAPPHYEETPVTSAVNAVAARASEVAGSASAVSSRMLETLVERLRTLESETAGLRERVADYQQRLLITAHRKSSDAASELLRFLSTIVPSTAWNFGCILFAFWLCGFRPNANSPLFRLAMWIVVKRQKLMSPRAVA
ncbi:Acyl-CoA-binding domain-containing protein 4 [Thoreauomyces humboldtii]|nr:Acyl-CoA-binding domain-containing protein 4 [Thoreauomyces humboldtii]